MKLLDLLSCQHLHNSNVAFGWRYFKSKTKSIIIVETKSVVEIIDNEWTDFVSMSYDLIELIFEL